MGFKTKIKTTEVRNFWKHLDEVSKEVDNWPDYMKVDGYVTRKWTLKKKEEKKLEKKANQ